MCSSKREVSELRSSVCEIKSVLTSRKSGQTDLKKLWLQKTELAESLRMLNAIELLKVCMSVDMDGYAYTQRIAYVYMYIYVRIYTFVDCMYVSISGCTNTCATSGESTPVFGRCEHAEYVCTRYDQCGEYLDGYR